MMDQKTYVLSEIKTLLRTLNAWGDVLAPSLDGKEVTCSQRLAHFVNRAQSEFGLSMGDIDAAIA